MLKILHLSVACMLILPLTVLGQKNERIKYKADELYEFRENGEKIRRLTGNVVFMQDGTLMYCDSSNFYVRANRMEAFGSVKIVDDSAVITSKRLIYDGKRKHAKLREDVVYTKGEQQLFTNFLDYDTETEVANYFNSGKLKDSTNILSSRIGYYYSLDDFAVFEGEVFLEAPDYTLSTDSLEYDTNTKVALTYTRTEIVNEDGSVLHAKGGEFRTDNDQSEFVEGFVDNEDYILEGDELFFDDLRQYYTAKGNVKLTSKKEDVIIYGDDGYMDKDDGISKVYGRALMKRMMKRDTFYISADTLVSIESDYDSLERVLAYYNVKMWRFNMQGLADSAAYFNSDSTVFLYNDPILWNKDQQIVGDTIAIEISNDQIKQMSILQNSFLIGLDTLKNYNQVKGRTMEAYFTEGRIQKIDVDGNGEAIYYVLDDSDSLETKTLGLNYILCSNLTIRFVNEELDNISFYKKPEARFIPPHEWIEADKSLKGFQWRGDERPTKEEVLNGVTRAEESEAPEQILLPRTGVPNPEPINKEGLPARGRKLLKKAKSKEE